MNNYYTLKYLNREIKEKILGAIYNFGISPHKDVLHLYLDCGEETRRLIFSTNPTETVLFLDFYRPPKKSNVIDFFPELEGRKVTDMRLAEKDRLVSIFFDNGICFNCPQRSISTDLDIFSGITDVIKVKSRKIYTC